MKKTEAALCRCGHVHNRHVGGGACMAYVATPRQCNCDQFSAAVKPVKETKK